MKQTSNVEVLSSNYTNSFYIRSGVLLFEGEIFKKKKENPLINH